MLKTESRMSIFSCAYAGMTSLVTLRLLSTFKGEFPVFQIELRNPTTSFYFDRVFSDMQNMHDLITWRMPYDWVSYLS